MLLMTMAEIGTLIGLISTGFALLSGVVTFFIKAFPLIKEAIKNKNWVKIAAIADKAMAAAEASGKNGEEKKEQVIKAVEVACKEMNVELDVVKLVNYINDSIKFANDIMNANK